MTPLSKWVVTVTRHSSLPTVSCVDCGFEAEGFGREPTLAELVAVVGLDSDRHDRFHAAWARVVA